MLTFKAIPFPIVYGILYGYGFVGSIEKSITHKSSFSIGYKYLKYGYHATGEHDVFIVEYRQILSKKSNEYSYLIPYLKYRNMESNTQIESNVYGEYREKSLGIGLSFGTKESLSKTKRFTYDLFGGFAYFIKLDKYGRTYGNGIGPVFVPYEPDFIMHGFDLRIGALFGVNLLR